MRSAFFDLSVKDRLGSGQRSARETWKVTKVPDLCALTELCKALGSPVRRFIAERLASRFFCCCFYHTS